MEDKESPFEKYVMIATGRLRRGRLHGFVVVNGVLSNDPESLCATRIVGGVGFVGNFRDGVPHGVCWRDLVGGASIYGEVDKEGLFTGRFSIRCFISSFSFLVNCFLICCLPKNADFL